MPFDTQTCQLAQEMKRLGIDWRPHVGCFVWDPDNAIEVDSPFPHRIYFVLSLPRFINIFGSLEAVAEKLVWLPTWHQARLLCTQLNIPDEVIAAIWQDGSVFSTGEELHKIYQLIIGALQER